MRGCLPRTAMGALMLLGLWAQVSAALAGGSLQPLYQPSTVSNWTGCYAGGYGGGTWGDSDKWIPRTPGRAFEGVSLGSHDIDGFIGGLQAGCDYQLANGVVLGVGGSYGWTDADGTHPSARETGVFYHSEVENLGSLTGRLGYAVSGNALIYVKGGVAWERANYAAATTMIGTAFRASDTRTGWTIGGGGEYAISKHISAFVEYDYYDFGTDRITLTPQFSFLPTSFIDIEDTANVVRAGINLRFGLGH